jgi:hypothetical protein
MHGPSARALRANLEERPRVRRSKKTGANGHAQIPKPPSRERRGRRYPGRTRTDGRGAVHEPERGLGCCANHTADIPIHKSPRAAGCGRASSPGIPRLVRSEPVPCGGRSKHPMSWFLDPHPFQRSVTPHAGTKMASFCLEWSHIARPCPRSAAGLDRVVASSISLTRV